MGKFLKLARDFIDKGCLDNGSVRDVKHYERTLYWLLQLKPDADEALQIAAYCHDAERVFRTSDYSTIHESVKGFRDETHLEYHQNTGAKIVSDFLLKNGAKAELSAKVSSLISKHEVGGTGEQNLLKDADSLSFFETNVEFFLTKQVEKMGKDKVKEKFDWMYQRISSEKARNVARRWYTKALQELG